MRPAKSRYRAVAPTLISDVDKSPDIPNRHTPDAAAVQCLLGKLHQGNDDMKAGASCYVEALKLNPFMWDAFERLCQTGNDGRSREIGSCLIVFRH